MISSLTVSRPRRARRLALATVAVAAALGGASAASAAAPTGLYADFNHCPTADATVTSCIFSQTTSGSFKLGNATVPINKTITLQGGSAQDGDSGFRFINASGAPTLSSTPLDVPGGLTGLVVPSQIQSIPVLGPLFNAAVNSVNGVKATAELVGPVGYNFTNFLLGDAPTVTLPVRVKLDNPFLGNNCYIGSAAHPVTFQLRTGTTAPPAPNTPITGTYGTLQFLDSAQLVTSTGYSLVDNAFSVPAAENCGPTGFQWAVTPIVNLKEGLPSAAGKNAAVLNGNLKSGDAAAVRASTH